LSDFDTNALRGSLTKIASGNLLINSATDSEKKINFDYYFASKTLIKMKEKMMINKILVLLKKWENWKQV